MGLKELRQSKNMTQKELADMIGVSVGTISRYESGKVSPTVRRLEQLFLILGAETDYLSFPNSEQFDNVMANQEILGGLDYYLRCLILLKTGGRCELCRNPAPFIDKKGYPYLLLYKDCAKSPLL